MKKIENKFTDILNSKYNTTEVKETLKRVQKYIKKMAGNYKDEGATLDEVKEQALSEKDSNFDMLYDVMTIYNYSAQFRGVRELLKINKHQPLKFKKMCDYALKKEENSSDEELYSSFNMQEYTMSLLRTIIRENKIDKAEGILRKLSKGKDFTERNIKKENLKILTQIFRSLNNYGIIDEYVELNNLFLKEHGIESVSYLKETGVADDYSSDRDDIGLFDVFDKKVFDNMSSEEINLFSTVWQNIFLEEMEKIYICFSVIENLDLWEVIIDGNDEQIEQISDKSILAALQKENFLMFLKNNLEAVEEVPESLLNRYYEFIEKNGIRKKELKEEILTFGKEADFLSKVLENNTNMQTIVIQDLKSNNLQNRKWGVIENDEEFCMLIIRNSNFVGPIAIKMQTRTLESCLKKIGNTKFPKYKNANPQLIEKLCRICIPANESYNKKVEETAKESSTSEVVDFFR